METQESLGNPDGLLKSKMTNKPDRDIILNKVKKVQRNGSKKKTYQHTTTTYESGRPVTEEIKKYHIKKKSRVFTFSFDLGKAELSKLKSRPAANVFNYLCAMVEFGSNVASLCTGIKADLAESLGISTQQVHNAITTLKKEGFILNDKGKIFVNPFYSYKGDFRDLDEIEKKWLVSVTKKPTKSKKNESVNQDL